MSKRYKNLFVIGLLLIVLASTPLSRRNEVLVAGDEDIGINPLKVIMHIDGDEDIDINPL